jgi:hypothetical protein
MTTQRISQALFNLYSVNNGQYLGNLKLYGVCSPTGGRYIEVYTYQNLLAIIEFSHVAHINVDRYSVTSSKHRNQLIRTLAMLGYSITEVPDEQTLKDVQEAMLGLTAVDVAES